MVKLRKILVPRRRKKPRPDAPRTIIPASEPAAKIDAARERLRSQIPPRGED